MNAKQKAVIALAVIALLVTALAQPRSEKYSLFNTTVFEMSHFSMSRLLAAWAIVIAVAVVLSFAVGNKDGR